MSFSTSSLRCSNSENSSFEPVPVYVLTTTSMVISFQRMAFQSRTRGVDSIDLSQRLRSCKPVPLHGESIDLLRCINDSASQRIAQLPRLGRSSAFDARCVRRDVRLRTPASLTPQE